MQPKDNQPQLRLTEPFEKEPRTKPPCREAPNNTLGYDCTHSSSFDAILEAYAKDPERWDGLE